MNVFSVHWYLIGLNIGYSIIFLLIFIRDVIVGIKYKNIKNRAKNNNEYTFAIKSTVYSNIAKDK